MTRERGTIVRTLAFPDGVHPAYVYALVWVGTDAYVICSEGVGWKVTTDEPLTVDGYRKTTHGLAAASWDMSLAEVLTASVHGRDVDLADFVRTFGDRLECNFYLWYQKLNGK